MTILKKLGRTFAFYSVFYSALFALLAFTYFIFHLTINEKCPKYILEESIIGINPGLGFRPLPPKSDQGSTLIWYQANNETNIKYWVNEIELFLKDYKLNGKSTKNKCDYNSPSNKIPCEFDVNNLNPCTPDNKFNYPNAAPCIFLKLNKIYGWVPQFYNNTNKLPNNMPAELKNIIKGKSQENKHFLNTVWIICNGEDPVDQENIGSIDYIPQGFPGYYYPFKNNEGYLSPLVAVIFNNLKRNVIINIECTHWAQNIFHTSKRQMGILHFEILVD